MNLKYTGIFVAAAFLLAAYAHAAEITAGDAQVVARGFARRGVRLGVILGSEVQGATAHRLADGTVFYTVKLYGGGTLVTSGDSRMAPVLAVLPGEADYSKLDKKSPLWAFLKRDLTAARQALDETPVVSCDYVRVARRAAVNEAQWEALWDEGQRAGLWRSAASGDYDPMYGNLEDVRVPAILKTKWGQSVNYVGTQMFNFCTPNGPEPAAFQEGDPNNAPCGCVATAMGQVLYHLKWPTATELSDPARVRERECSWTSIEDNGAVTNTSTFTLAMSDEPYDWEMMPRNGWYGLDGYDEENYRAVSRLLLEAGISVGMGYSSEGGSASGDVVVNALRKSFGVKSAVMYDDTHKGFTWGTYSPESNETLRSNVLQRVFFSNFDAGLPVIVGLAGHEVVADGYGYNDGADFIHFNMGWGDLNEVWYNVPNLVEPTGGFWGIEDVVYNIFTNETDKAILSGRVLDLKGNVLSGAQVAIYEAGTDNVIVSNLVTSSSGVWAQILDPGTYDVRATTADGQKLGLLQNVELSLPNTTMGTDAFGEAYPVVRSDDTDDAGNSWGNDIVVAAPNILVGSHYCETFEAAVEVAEAGDTIRILRPALFEHSVTGLVNCTIKVEDGVDATNAIVSVSKGVRLYIASGARVLMSGETTGLHFACADDALVVALAGGRLALGGEIRMPMVETADGQGFELTGPIHPVDGRLYLNCKSAPGRDGVCGLYTGSYPAISDNARTNVYNWCDRAAGEDILCACADSATGNLVWDRWTPPASALASYESPEESRPGPTYYKTLTTLFTDCTNASTVKLYKDCGPLQFRGPVSVRRPLTITGKGIVPDASAGFTVEAGGTLTLQNVTFSNYVGKCLFKVAGGELVLTNGANLVNLRTGADCYEKSYGTTAVLAGKLTMYAGAKIRDCHACHYNGRGGAIYIENGLLDLRGGEIRDCSATSCGGGVYAYNGVNANYSAEVRLSGGITFRDNTATTDACADNLYLAFTNNPPRVTGALTGSKFLGKGPIGIRYANAVGNAAGAVAARLAFETPVDGAGTNQVAEAFRSDANDKLVGGVAEGQIVWAEPVAAGDECSPAVARCVVRYDATPDVPHYYQTVDKTFANILGDATVTVTNYTSDADTSFHYYRAIEISHRIVLKGADGVSDAAIRRHAKCPIHISSGGELILTNLIISGSYSGGGIYPLIQVEGGKLELRNGAQLRSASGNESRACGGVVVWDGGVFTMRTGSLIYNCGNQYNPVKASERGVGGGLLVENATAYLTGGRINGCYTAVAGAGGGVCLANGAKAYLSGDLYIWGNGSTANNIVVEDSSKLYLAGEIPESGTYVGVDPGIRTDTNFVAYVSWEGATAEQLQKSAARFRKSTDEAVKGVVVTNGAGEAVIVWSDELARNGQYVSRDDVTYRLRSAPSLTLATPKTFSVRTQSRGSDKRNVLTLDGGVEGCWYTVYSTTSLDEPFEAEATIHLGAGETFEYATDADASSKFYKVVAEEGIRQE